MSQRLVKKLRYVALTTRERALAALGLEIDYDYHTGKEKIRSTADKLRDPQPQPPWLFYGERSVDWSGWRQGNGHGWLMRVWNPFWQSLSAEQHAQYLAHWPPPDEDWRAWIALLTPRADSPTSG